MTKLSNTEFKDPNEGVLVTLALDEILVDETMNLRQDGWEKDKTIEALCEDITEKGQLQPVLVTPYIPLENEQNGIHKYSLVAGFRRYRAIEMANNEGGQDLSVLARVVSVDAHGAMLDNLAENIQRKNLSPIDVAHAAIKLSAAGLGTKEIAKAFDKSDTWLRQNKAFLDLRKNLQNDIHSGKLDFGVARKLIGLTDEEQDEVLNAVRQALEVGEGGQQAAEKARKEVTKDKKKSGKGRKAKGDTPAVKKGLSAKAAVLILEETVAEVKAQEKILKADARSVEVYDLVVKFLHGKFGAQSFHKKMVELLGA